MDLSIVIPTYNRAGLLRRTVPALASQEGDFDYEVILVSNGSTDETEDVLRAAEQEYPGKIRYYRIEPTGGPAAPRNFGIRKARGDVIVILDDDVLPEPGLARGHLEFHRKFPQQHHAGVGEAYVPEGVLEDPMSYFHTFPYDEIRHLERLSYLHFWTCNVSFKREFMLEKGMFDERFLYYEDVFCAYRMEKNGMFLHFVPDARGQHLHQLKPSGVLAKGLFTGLWLYAFEQEIPERAVRERFGILSRDLGPLLFAKRLVKRIALLAIANPLTFAILRAAGATGGKRSRLSDAYYFLLFRRSILRGYSQAKSAARKARSSGGASTEAEWVDRGET